MIIFIPTGVTRKLLKDRVCDLYTLVHDGLYDPFSNKQNTTASVELRSSILWSSIGIRYSVHTGSSTSYHVLPTLYRASFLIQRPHETHGQSFAMVIAMDSCMPYSFICRSL